MIQYHEGAVGIVSCYGSYYGLRIKGESFERAPWGSQISGHCAANELYAVSCQDLQHTSGSIGMRSYTLSNIEVLILRELDQRPWAWLRKPGRL